MTKRGGCLRDCFTRVLACAAFQTRILAGRRSGALICCFSAAVSLRVMRWLSDLAQKLWVRLAEWMTKAWWVLEVRTYV